MRVRIVIGDENEHKWKSIKNWDLAKFKAENESEERE
jgi:hypothetical protein